MITENELQFIGTKAQYMARFPNGTNRPCNIIDLETSAITSVNMELAITTYSGLYEVGSVFTCSESGTYIQGHLYKLVEEESILSWVDITPSTQTSTVTGVRGCILKASSWQAVTSPYGSFSQRIEMQIDTNKRNIIDVRVEGLQEYMNCGILATEQSTGLTFYASTQPTNDLVFDFVNQEVEYVNTNTI